MGLVRSVVIINGHLNKQERKKFAPRKFFFIAKLKHINLSSKNIFNILKASQLQSNDNSKTRHWFICILLLLN
jgi:hypothetical protein